MNIPTNADAMLTRNETASALSEAGFPVSPRTLASMATRGGGPDYSRFGRHALYRWGDALAWAKARTAKPARTAAEHREEAAVARAQAEAMLAHARALEAEGAQ